MESLVSYLTSLDPVWVYIVVAAIAFIENVFPPFPSDVLVVAAGSLSAANRVDPILIVAVSTIGSTAGFFVMYRIGSWLGRGFLETGKVRFISPEQVLKVEGWFQKYGYAVVVANRFLAGTRAVVSFFAGLSHLRVVPCIVLSLLSALVWNSILVWAGYELGSNWRVILEYLNSYAETVTSLLILAVLIYFGYRGLRKQTS